MEDLYGTSDLGTAWINSLRGGKSYGATARDVGSLGTGGLLSAYQRIANKGAIDVDAIMRGLESSSARRRALLARGMRTRFGKTYGSRSGGIQSLIANKVFLPESIGLTGQRSSLMQQNYLSRLEGLGGIGDIMRMIEERRRWQEQMDAAKPGLLDKLSPLLGFAGDIAGGFGSLMGAKSIGKGLESVGAGLTYK